jgi:hypothetical protein
MKIVSLLVILFFSTGCIKDFFNKEQDEGQEKVMTNNNDNNDKNGPEISCTYCFDNCFCEQTHSPYPHPSISDATFKQRCEENNDIYNEEYIGTQDGRYIQDRCTTINAYGKCIYPPLLLDVRVRIYYLDEYYNIPADSDDEVEFCINDGGSFEYLGEEGKEGYQQASSEDFDFGECDHSLYECLKMSGRGVLESGGCKYRVGHDSHECLQYLVSEEEAISRHKNTCQENNGTHYLLGCPPTNAYSVCRGYLQTFSRKFYYLKSDGGIQSNEEDRKDECIYNGGTYEYL